MQKKMIFRLDQDADGWPPVTAESVWVTARDDGRFVVGNIPFFATGATLDDVVEATWKDGELRYVTTAESSGNSLLRVIYPRGTDPGEARKGLEHLGCSTELDSGHRVIAVNVPPQVDLGVVLDFLQQGTRENGWDYEEALLMQ